MKPCSSVIVLPIHDPGGILFPWLERVAPDLKTLFARAFVSLSPATPARQPGWVDWLRADPFFTVNFNQPGTLPGEHFMAGYRSAFGQVAPETMVHLVDVDRIAYALLNGYREVFLADVAWASAQQQPVLFERSAAAWATYPANYRELEHMLIRVGELIFGRYLDFAWSYLAARASLLAQVLPQVTSRDFGILVELVLLLEDRLLTREVDWLAWEDPFILGREADELRRQRDSSREETLKRLRGLLPFFQHFLEKAPPLRGDLRWDRPAQ